MLVSSILAGLLWDIIGPRATFWAGACFALVGYLGFVIRRRHIGSLPA